MYVDFLIDRDNSTLKVVERVNGKRQYREFPLVLEFFVPDPSGRYQGYDGVRLKQIKSRKLLEFYGERKRAVNAGQKTYEAFFNLPNKVLYEHYLPKDVPELHTSFLDIECDRLGHENYTISQMIYNADCPINAVSVYNNWQDKLYTLMLCPENLTMDEAREIASKFENTYVMSDEKDLLIGLISILDDADCCSGWNTNGFDIPYIVRRVSNLLGVDGVRKLCLFDETPVEKEEYSMGQRHLEYTLPGKWCADYMLLYKKHQTSVKESYKLNSIAIDELGEQKVEYTGTLDDLYRDDYENFIRYNRQDTMLVKRLEDKLKYIEIHNRQAHGTRCSFENTMGTVAYTDQSIINRAHDLGKRIPDKVEGKTPEYDGIVPPGAYVPTPVPGIANNIMSYDMASLYPSSAMALNISPETMIGQVKLDLTIPYLHKKIEDNKLYRKVKTMEPDWGAAWSNEWGTLEYTEILNQTNTTLTIQLMNGNEVQRSAKEIYEMIFSDGSNMNISPMGTIFRTDQDGIIKTVLSEWFAERKSCKKKKEHYEFLESGVSLVKLPDILQELKNVDFKQFIPEGNTTEYDVNIVNNYIKEKNISELIQYMKNNYLYLSDDDRILSYNRPLYKTLINYWDLEQYVIKIRLNSLYGAILNNASIFYDFRLGSSITMTGRRVWMHLASKGNELLCGKYTHLGGCILTGDTDSVYLTLNDEFKKIHPNFDYSKDNMVKFADEIGKQINDTFFDYMIEKFHCCPDGAAREKASRECVASRALVCGKKRYAMMVFDKDGFREDVDGKPGKLKIMGIQTQRSDLAKPVRAVLKEMIKTILVGGEEKEVGDVLKDFYFNTWTKIKPWNQGSPKPLNKMALIADQLKQGMDGCNKQRIVVPTQIKAAFNFNNLIDYYGDTKTKKLVDGDKVLVCRLNPNNELRMDTVAISIELGEDSIPQWFKDLPFDDEKTDASVDKTISTVFGVLNWDLSLKHLTYKEPDATQYGIQFL